MCNSFSALSKRFEVNKDEDKCLMPACVASHLFEVRLRVQFSLAEIFDILGFDGILRAVSGWVKSFIGIVLKTSSSRTPAIDSQLCPAFYDDTVRKAMRSRDFLISDGGYSILFITQRSLLLCGEILVLSAVLFLGLEYVCQKYLMMLSLCLYSEFLD